MRVAEVQGNLYVSTDLLHQASSSQLNQSHLRPRLLPRLDMIPRHSHPLRILVARVKVNRQNVDQSASRPNLRIHILVKYADLSFDSVWPTSGAKNCRTLAMGEGGEGGTSTKLEVVTISGDPDFGPVSDGSYCWPEIRAGMV